MTPRLRIASSGMCCPVGFSARAARAAIRGRLNRFEESEFIDKRSEPLVVSRLPLGDIWGPRRMAMMFESALRDCLAGAEEVKPESTAFCLLVAERGRVGYNEAWAKACLAVYDKCIGAPPPGASHTFTAGRAGLAMVLRHAHTLLREGQVRQVIVAGVDSYLNAHTIAHLLHKDRLLTGETSAGFIPGEGVGVLLLSLEAKTQGGLHVLGVGSAEEKATLDNDEPSRALGLTAALREALAASGCTMNDLDFRISDVSGTPLFFTEAATANTRLLDHRSRPFPLLHLADCIGETGAAIGPLSLAYLCDAMARGYAPGARAVLQLSNEEGARAAVVVEQFVV